MTGVELLAVAVGVLLLGGLASALLPHRQQASAAAVSSAVAGSTLAAIAALTRLLGAGEAALHLPWSVPGGPCELALDPLGAWFCLVVALLAGPIAVHAASYVAAEGRQRYGAFGLCFNLLTASLLLMSAARDVLVFVAAWELATVTAYLSIVRRHEVEYVRWAGRLYLIANHCASFCLLALAAWLAAVAGSTDFVAISTATSRSALPAALPVTLALVAFGTKAGIVPFHIWLPHAHPAAPSPVSALLSGVVIKAGIFGILRFLPLLPPMPPWPGALILALGAVAAVLGVLYALAQHELKRLLAYHSVENIGIILLGIGAGVIGARTGHPTVAVLGFCGALLHMLNHALFKGLLFLAAGSMIHNRESSEIDRLGGIARTMPWTAALFLIGCVSICGLPPCNGFVSEWTVYRAMFGETEQGSGAMRLWPAGGILALALVGGLAAACFAKAFAVVFLGSPREAHARDAGEAPAGQIWAMGVLAVLCVGIGLFPQLVVVAAWPAAEQLGRALGGGAPPAAAEAAEWLSSISTIGLGLLACIAAIVLARLAMGRSRPQADADTWACGFALPHSRMQYTASSFAAPLLALFQGLLWTRTRSHRIRSLFPRSPAVHSDTPDAAEAHAFRPAYKALLATGRAFRLLQRAPVQIQILMAMVALAALLFWKVTL